MATGLPQVLVGGDFSTFQRELGNYRVKVVESALLEASSGRPGISLEVNVCKDPNHPSMEGKKLIVDRTYFADPKTDEAEKLKMMNGMAKRKLYDGFGLAWPTKAAPIDPRKWLGKEVYCQLRQKAGEEFPFIHAYALKADGLPKMPKDANKAPEVPAVKAKAEKKSTPEVDEDF